MQSDPQEKSTSRAFRIVNIDRSTRIFRRLLRLVFNGLQTCLQNRHPEVEDFDEIYITGEEIVVEKFHNGILVERIRQRRKNFTIPIVLIGAIISSTAYYFLR